MRLINTKTFKLEEFSDHDAPPYAILSHTWGPDIEELTLSDVKKANINKPGIGSFKFRECCKQAQADSLGYAWIDTCCIDKTNLVELGEAINSMFRWYSLATVCYAYLSDVPDNKGAFVPGPNFQKSRWFKRGWTLQELLAPKHLRFYNSEWRCIGTKGNRCTVIQEITRVPRQFLLGVTELHVASVAQRMSWAAQRETKRAEDLAYCLLGIFGITMPMIYGEGGKEAFFRLQEQIMRTTRDDSILAWGLNTGPPIRNPQEAIDGDMFVYGDILAATPSDFANSGQIIAREQATNPLHSLDIFGGSLRVYLPLLTINTGETFGLLGCGPKYDTKQVAAIPLAKINSAVANEYVRPRGSPSVLHPVPTSDASPELIHIKKDGQKNISTKNQQYLFYDVDLFDKLGLEVIEVAPRSCWDDQRALISFPSTGQILIRTRQKKKQSLDFLIIIDLDLPDSRADLLCCVLICHRKTTLDKIASKFQRKTLEAFAQAEASDRALHLQIELEPMEGNITSITPKVMVRPPDYTVNATTALKNLDLVLESTRLLWEKKQNDAEMESLNRRTKDNKSRLGHIKEKLETIESEYRRIAAEKRTLVEEQDIKTQETQRLREEQVAIRKRQTDIFKQVTDSQKRLVELHNSEGCEDGWIPLRSAMAMGDIDMMDLLFDETADYMAEDKRWIPWITAARKGDADAIQKLLTSTDGPEFNYKDGIFGRTPLSWASGNGHLYVVELLLRIGKNKVNAHSKDKGGRTPAHWALERGHYDVVQLLLQHDGMESLRKLSGHDKAVDSLAFSPDSKLIASGSTDTTVKLWDSATGKCIYTFRGHDDCVDSVAFSNDSKLIASGSRDNTAKLWDTTTGEYLRTLQGYDGHIDIVIFSHDSKLVATGSNRQNIKLWDSATGECLRTLHGRSSVESVVFSHDSKFVASGHFNSVVNIWDSTTGDCLHTLQGHNVAVSSVAFSHDSKIVVSGSVDGSVRFWDSTSGECQRMLKAWDGKIENTALSRDLKVMAGRISSDGIKLWDNMVGECIQNFGKWDDGALSIALSHDSKLMASSSYGKEIVLWDTSIMHGLVTSSWYENYRAAKANNTIPSEQEKQN